MKTVLLLLNSDRFSFPLIQYLAAEGKRYGWRICVGSMFENGLHERIKECKFSQEVIFINMPDFRQCETALRKADLVIALLPDVLLLKVVDRCLIHGKSLITPSRLKRQMVSRKSLAEENNTLILMECGFSPGLDHITAKKVVDTIHMRGGKISSFKTYSGSLIADCCLDNPWEFKLTEPTDEVLRMGKYNNRHLVDGHLQHIPYQHLLDRSEPIHIPGIQNTLTIPEGDALYYRKIYRLSEATTFIKGKIIRKEFKEIWNLIVKLGLTDHTSKVDMTEGKSYHDFLNSFLPYCPKASLEERISKYIHASEEEIEKLKWLGLFSDECPKGGKELTPAILIGHLLEKNFALNTDDKDAIVMQHQFEYTDKTGDHKITATLVGQGENQRDSAIAKAIGLTTGAAAKSILIGNIKIKGLHIPTHKEIYDPILNELDDLGVAFQIEEKKLIHASISSEPIPVLIDNNLSPTILKKLLVL